jgi:hypothetical protein
MIAMPMVYPCNWNGMKTIIDSAPSQGRATAEAGEKRPVAERKIRDQAILDKLTSHGALNIIVF